MKRLSLRKEEAQARQENERVEREKKQQNKLSYEESSEEGDGESYREEEKSNYKSEAGHNDSDAMYMASTNAGSSIKKNTLGVSHSNA